MMVVSAGEALVDLVPEARPGGGPFNAAVACARLGAATAFLGRISTDANGEVLMGHLESSGVDCRLVERGSEPTATAAVEYDPGPRFRFHGDGTADTCLTSADLTPLGPGPHVLHGGTLGMFRGRTAEVLAEAVECHDGLVSVDPNVRTNIIDDAAAWHRFHDRWARRADIYKVSDEDLTWIDPGVAAADAARTLGAGGCSLVLVTRGSAGVVAFAGDRCIEVAAPEITVVDSVGAGDSFIGAVLASLWHRNIATREQLAGLGPGELTEILELAVTVAAITCTRVGADPPTPAEASAWRSVRG